MARRQRSIDYKSTFDFMAVDLSENLMPEEWNERCPRCDGDIQETMLSDALNTQIIACGNCHTILAME